MRKLMLLLLAGVLVLGMTAFAEKITLTFLTPLGGEDGAYMDAIIEQFNSTHPDIEVQHLVIVSSVDYKMKLSTGLASGTAPEVLFIRKPDIPQYLPYLKTFAPDELREVYGIDVDDIYPSIREGLVEDDTVYGIPLDCWIFYMAYNRANFLEAGLDPSDPPTNKEEFFAACEALKAITPEGVTPYYENPTWSWIWIHYMWQFGGDLLTPDFKEPAFEEAGAAALRLMVEMQDRGYLPSAPVDPGPPFLSGEATFLITGVWTVRAFEEALGEDLGAAPAPQFGTTKAVFGGSHVLALPEVMVRDPKVLEAAMTWVKYLWDHAIEWYAAGQTPARISIAQSEELKERLPKIYAIAQQLPYVHQFQMFPYIAEIIDTIAPYNEKVLITRELTPEEAMSQAAEAVRELLEEYGL